MSPRFSKAQALEDLAAERLRASLAAEEAEECGPQSWLFGGSDFGVLPKMTLLFLGSVLGAPDCWKLPDES